MEKADQEEMKKIILDRIGDTKEEIEQLKELTRPPEIHALDYEVRELRVSEIHK